jgi:hypothetical protein
VQVLAKQRHVGQPDLIGKNLNDGDVQFAALQHRAQHQVHADLRYHHPCGCRRQKRPGITGSLLSRSF